MFLFSTTIVNGQNSTINEYTMDSADPQLMFTLAQVSGVFVAIVAGLYTTKIISIDSEKNRLKTRIAELDTEIKGKATMFNHYEQIIEDIETKWAEERINYFTDEILEDGSVKKYTLEELKQKFSERYRGNMNSYEENVLEAKFDDINKKIEEQLSKPKTIFDSLNLAPKIARISNLGSIAQIQDERKTLDDAYRKRAVEESNIEIQRKMKDQISNELKTLLDEKYFARGIAYLFVFAMLGVVFPLFYTYWSPLMGTLSNMIALVAFLIGLVLTLLYIGHEVERVLKN